jgi:adenylosuccinate synthase
MPLDIIVGAQWGDEGKGRVVDLLAAQADFVARYNGGDNAGHTVTVGEQTFKLHLIPSGIIHPHTIGLIGNGVVVNPATLIAEMEMLAAAGIDVFPQRLRLSLCRSSDHSSPSRIGSSPESAADRSNRHHLRGIGPAYTSKVSRQGLRLLDLLDRNTFREALRRHIDEINRILTALYRAPALDPEPLLTEFDRYAEKLAPYIGDVSAMLSESLAHGRRVLAEGAQGTLLDLDHGTYPFVTSSNPTAPGALVGLGLGLGSAERVVGVTKAFQTRVGAGPFPTEVAGDLALRLRGSGQNPWDEYGTTTGRPRRVGWLDMVLLRYAARVNGLTELALTKLDILSGLPTIHICVAYRDGEKIYADLPYGPSHLSPFQAIYEDLPGWDVDLHEVRDWEDLPDQARAYILRIEELSGVPVRLVSVGPERAQVVDLT